MFSCCKISPRLCVPWYLYSVKTCSDVEALMRSSGVGIVAQFWPTSQFSGRPMQSYREEKLYKFPKGSLNRNKKCITVTMKWIKLLSDLKLTQSRATIIFLLFFCLSWLEYLFQLNWNKYWVMLFKMHYQKLVSNNIKLIPEGCPLSPLVTFSLQPSPSLPGTFPITKHGRDAFKNKTVNNK